MKFCFVCGKETEKLIEGHCEDCYNKSFNLIEIPKEIIIVLCSKCKKIRQKNMWKDIEIEDLVKNSVKILGRNVEITLNGDKVLAKGLLKNSKKAKEETHEIIIRIIKTTCPECSKKLGGYYESIIQLRGDVTEEVLNFIDREAKKTFYRTEPVKEGFNLYFGDKNIAGQIADKLKRRYNFEIKKSFKLFTRKEGMDIYKSTFLIRCD
jgi:nonsense-mediated mRNA decay protein 3